MNERTKEQTVSNRILVTPSSYARSQYLFVQEVGTLKSLAPHISRREKLESFLFFLVLEGEGSVSCEQQVYHLKAGHCVWLDCRRPYSHESSAEHPWSLMWVHFYGVQAPEFYKNYLHRGGAMVFLPSTFSRYMETLQSLYNLQSGKDALSDLLCHKYLTDLISFVFQDTLPMTQKLSVPQKFMDIQSYLKKHYQEKITLDSLTDAFYISKYHLAREYQRLFGTTVLNDLTLIRLSHAKRQLRFSTENIEEIALSCGFQTSAYFIKVFKKYENMTPLEYRRKW